MEVTRRQGKESKKRSWRDEEAMKEGKMSFWEVNWRRKMKKKGRNHPFVGQMRGKMAFSLEETCNASWK